MKQYLFILLLIPLTWSSGLRVRQQAQSETSDIENEPIMETNEENILPTAFSQARNTGKIFNYLFEINEIGYGWKEFFIFTKGIEMGRQKCLLNEGDKFRR